MDAVCTSVLAGARIHDMAHGESALLQWVRVEGNSRSCGTSQCQSRPDLFIKMKDKIPEFMFTYKASAEGQDRRFVPNTV